MGLELIQYKAIVESSPNMGYGNDSFFLGSLRGRLGNWFKSPLAASVKSGTSP